MQRKIYIAVMGVIAGVLTFGSAYSQTSTTITTAVPFQLISPDARSSGMGDVGAGIADNANAIYWNPAGLRQLGGIHLMASYDVFIETVRYQYFAGATRLGNDAAIG